MVTNRNMLLSFLLISGVALAASQSCQNTSPLCGASPGWPLLSMCFDHDYVFASCPEFCGQCTCATDPRGPCYNGGTRGGNPANYNERTCDCNCVGAWTGDLCQYCGLTCVHGTLDSSTCTCSCAPGWDGPTCSDVCADSSTLCGANPGWPTVASCSVDYVAESCHLFCGVCSGGSGVVVTQPTTTTKTTTTPPPCDWQIVFEIRPGVGDWAVDAWGSEHTHTGHFKSPLVDMWDTLGVKRVKVSLFQGAEVRELIFNGVNSDKFSWFSKDRLLTSPWADLPTEPNNFFSIDGETNPDARRTWFISRNYGGCPNDAGWLVVVETGPQGSCEWERVPAGPGVLYSRKSTYVNWTSGGADIGVADRMVISIDTCSP
ncbi:uncharacterized protein LOC118423503 isoform X1 [Branchiostoma floridae]|uniref:Uncharacterized protein LOC118423503 isoform X1 n=1 Tax=Branchiostoma floridae TaxID=7739 RepID=A0A9J7LS57_BRAFL|nr:uncharacterized protein LOC118423503 isoform X1 [Branchiostoma floridae]